MDALAHLNEPLIPEQTSAVLAMVVGLVFGYAALRKLGDLPSTISAIKRYRFFPARLAGVLAGLIIATFGRRRSPGIYSGHNRYLVRVLHACRGIANTRRRTPMLVLRWGTR
jgi:hypothetical protein